MGECGGGDEGADGGGGRDEGADGGGGGDEGAGVGGDEGRGEEGVRNLTWWSGFTGGAS